MSMALPLREAHLRKTLLATSNKKSMEQTMKLAIVSAGLAVILASCASATATRTSSNTITIDAGAAPVCGRQGAGTVASRSAAIETIRAGFSRYIITGGQYENNVRVSRMPGSYDTSGTFYGYRVSATTTYTPGPTIIAGRHDRMLNVVMFRPGDAGYSNAIDARAALGPDWREAVKRGVRTCL